MTPTLARKDTQQCKKLCIIIYRIHDSLVTIVHHNLYQSMVMYASLIFPNISKSRLFWTDFASTIQEREHEHALTFHFNKPVHLQYP